MENIVKELRAKTKKSQREFANTYKIPLSTLKKWEQNESKPAPYFLYLLSNDIDNKNHLIEITDMEHSYYYDDINGKIYNKEGDCIKIECDVLKANKNNLMLYLSELNEQITYIKNDFNLKCTLDRKENIVWRSMKK